MLVLLKPERYVKPRERIQRVEIRCTNTLAEGMSAVRNGCEGIGIRLRGIVGVDWSSRGLCLWVPEPFWSAHKWCLTCLVWVPSKSRKTVVYR